MCMGKIFYGFYAFELMIRFLAEEEYWIFFIVTIYSKKQIIKRHTHKKLSRDTKKRRLSLYTTVRSLCSGLRLHIDVQNCLWLSSIE